MRVYKIQREIVLVWVAIAECHRFGDWGNKHLFLSMLEAGKSERKTLADGMCGESSPPSLQVGCFAAVVSPAGETCSFSFPISVIIPFKGTPLHDLVTSQSPHF